VPVVRPGLSEPTIVSVPSLVEADSAHKIAR
jgi:hypothetical protein